MIREPHLPHSPDLAPSHFWLFEHIKTAPAGQQFLGPDGLLTGIQQFLSEIQMFELELVFHH
jgi:hypothetical protein